MVKKEARFVPPNSFLANLIELGRESRDIIAHTVDVHRRKAAEEQLLAEEAQLELQEYGGRILQKVLTDSGLLLCNKARDDFDRGRSKRRKGIGDFGLYRRRGMVGVYEDVVDTLQGDVAIFNPNYMGHDVEMRRIVVPTGVEQIRLLCPRHMRESLMMGDSHKGVKVPVWLKQGVFLFESEEGKKKPLPAGIKVAKPSVYPELYRYMGLGRFTYQVIT